MAAELPKRLGASSGTVATVALVDNGASSTAYTIISAIIACNTDSVARTITLSTGASPTVHGIYIAYQQSIQPNTSATFEKIVLDGYSGARYLLATASNAAVHVSVFGVQGA